MGETEKKEEGLKVGGTSSLSTIDCVVTSKKKKELPLLFRTSFDL